MYVSAFSHLPRNHFIHLVPYNHAYVVFLQFHYSMHSVLVLLHHHLLELPFSRPFKLCAGLGQNAYRDTVISGQPDTWCCYLHLSWDLRRVSVVGRVFTKRASNVQNEYRSTYDPHRSPKQEMVNEIQTIKYALDKKWNAKKFKFRVYESWYQQSEVQMFLLLLTSSVQYAKS